MPPLLGLRQSLRPSSHLALLLPLLCLRLQLSGATITLSEHVLDSGAREVLLAGTDVACNTAKNLMEALMRSG